MCIQYKAIYTHTLKKEVGRERTNKQKKCAERERELMDDRTTAMPSVCLTRHEHCKTGRQTERGQPSTQQAEQICENQPSFLPSPCKPGTLSSSTGLPKDHTILYVLMCTPHPSFEQCCRRAGSVGCKP